jgi:hypothetical protein
VGIGGADPPAAYDADWFRHARRNGTTTEQALEFFDTLAPLTPDDMLGRWKGSGFPTGHVLDGMLEVLGWYGKAFIDAETVHPLLFGEEGGKLVAVNPRWVPLKAVVRLRLKPGRLLRVAFDLIRPVIATTKPCARLRLTGYRGKISATMIYDAHPINDVFRRIGPDMLLGAMDYRELSTPFFFILERRPDAGAQGA